MVQTATVQTATVATATPTKAMVTENTNAEHVSKVGTAKANSVVAGAGRGRLCSSSCTSGGYGVYESSAGRLCSRVVT